MMICTYDIVFLLVPNSQAPLQTCVEISQRRWVSNVV